MMKTPIAKLLLVEDDQALAQMIVEFLTGEGFSMEWIDNGRKAVTRLCQKKDPPQLLILDVMLPELSGIDVCREIRGHYFNPILILTARDDDLTEINSLNRGADAYLTKPVRPHVLLAHIRSLLRRAVGLSESVSGNAPTLQVQDIELFSDSLAVTIGGSPLLLTTAEFQLLEYFMQRPGDMVTRDQLYRALRGLEYDGVDRSIDMRVSVVRKKMNDATPPFRYIKTVRGKGYLLAC